MNDSQRISPTIDEVVAMVRRFRGRRTDIVVSRTEDNRFFIQEEHTSVPIDITKVVRSEFRRAHPLGY